MTVTNPVYTTCAIATPVWQCSGAKTVLTIGRLLGHHQPATTLKYVHLSDDAARQAAEAVGSVLGGGDSAMPARVRLTDTAVGKLRARPAEYTVWDKRFRIVVEGQAASAMPATLRFSRRSSSRGLSMPWWKPMLPGAGRVFALVVTGCSVEDNRCMRYEYTAAVRRMKEAKQANAADSGQQSQPEPDVRLVPVKSTIFAGICEEIFGWPGGSGEGLEIASAALAKALDEVYEGLENRWDIGQEDWMWSTLATVLRERAEEQLPIGC